MNINKTKLMTILDTIDNERAYAHRIENKQKYIYEEYEYKCKYYEVNVGAALFFKHNNDLEL